MPLPRRQPPRRLPPPRRTTQSQRLTRNSQINVSFLSFNSSSISADQFTFDPLSWRYPVIIWVYEGLEYQRGSAGDGAKRNESEVVHGSGTAQRTGPWMWPYTKVHRVAAAVFNVKEQPDAVLDSIGSDYFEHTVKLAPTIGKEKRKRGRDVSLARSVDLSHMNFTSKASCARFRHGHW